ncbi:uncharacterized protein LOC143888906 [Tasmannia lanceolata]|uniref:uncharacterized protein LOC143888906 n=1 Tax=Tasmannia lanceolata TaxID=3420 RepID=UPI004063599A
MNNNGIPWISHRDFNVIRYLNEKFDGADLVRTDLEEFNNFIINCSLTDLKSLGQTLSWSNSSKSGDYKLRRLDRAIVNDDWLEHFPSSSANFNNPLISDHSPIIIHLLDNENPSPKPFRFFSMWLEDLPV